MTTRCCSAGSTIVSSSNPKYSTRRVITSPWARREPPMAIVDVPPKKAAKLERERLWPDPFGDC